MLWSKNMILLVKIIVTWGLIQKYFLSRYAKSWVAAGHFLVDDARNKPKSMIGLDNTPEQEDEQNQDIENLGEMINRKTLFHSKLF